MKNPTSKAKVNPQNKAKPFNRKAELAKIAKQVDKVRKRVERLRKGAPFSPALASAEQFMAQQGISSVGSTKWVQTPQQLREFKQFLRKFEKLQTATVPGAKAAQKKQLASLKDIMLKNGYDPKTYNVEDFYNKLNKIDVYQMIRDYGLTSTEITGALTRIMNVNAGRRVTAQQILKQIFGAPVKGKGSITKYNKGTKAHTRAKGTRKRGK